MASDSPRARFARRIATAITAVWAVSMIADIAIPTYSPSPFVHGAMLAVVGALFGGQAVRPK